MRHAEDASPLLTWTAALSVGIEVFDREHRAMIEAVNGVYAASLGTGDGQFADAVDRLITVAEHHFDHEEEVLRSHGCPGLEIHRREHEELLDDVNALRLLDNDRSTCEQVMAMLRDWLCEHIVNLDRSYRDCLAGKEIT